MKLFLISTLFIASGLSQPNIYLLKFSGPIGPVSADYIIDGINEGEDKGAIAVIIKLDTPGGLDESMREIVQRFFQAQLPIIVYVAPAGARAASAGVFITMSADVAVMADGTNIGAAHPVSVGGGEVASEMKEKITNDAVSYLVAIAEKRNRNKRWAEEAVRKSSSLSAREALKLGVIDFIANSDQELITKLDSVFSARGVRHQMPVTSARIINYNLSPWQRFLLFLTNPSVAYILLMLGVYGLFFELQSPGTIFPGAIGALCLILAFYSFRLLPTNYAGLALIGIAILFFILEVYITSYGLLSLGGIVSLIVGSLLLFQSSAPYFRLSLSLIIAVVVLTLIFFGFIIGFAIRAHKKKVTTGKEGLVDEIGSATTDLNLEGTVKVRGELWNAESIDGKINQGEKVKIVKVDGMTLKVKRLAEDPIPQNREKQTANSQFDSNRHGK
ncbi:MAG: nodulation protein NfeD [candidate division WOR-3 bacterium]|nr:nodulation protein NfeD [candidate division WOR-3 bacterium]